MIKTKTKTRPQKNKTPIKALLLLVLVSIGTAGPAFAREMENKPRIQLRSLDKITARTMTFDARVGSTLKFGSLYMKVQSCQKTTPIEQPESAAFLQIWEIDAKKQSHWVFSGWMFSSSPALSAMDHPIYDVWLIDCLDDEGTPEAAVEDQAGAPAEAAQETQSPAENEKDGIVTDEPPSNPGDMLE